jgi:hypothetical protein
MGVCQRNSHVWVTPSHPARPGDRRPTEASAALRPATTNRPARQVDRQTGRQAGRQGATPPDARPHPALRSRPQSAPTGRGTYEAPVPRARLRGDPHRGLAADRRRLCLRPGVRGGSAFGDRAVAVLARPTSGRNPNSRRRQCGRGEARGPGQPVPAGAGRPPPPWRVAAASRSGGALSRAGRLRPARLLIRPAGPPRRRRSPALTVGPFCPDRTSGFGQPLPRAQVKAARAQPRTSRIGLGPHADRMQTGRPVVVQLPRQDKGQDSGASRRQTPTARRASRPRPSRPPPTKARKPATRATLRSVHARLMRR